jgi:hypothetical protein
MLYSQDGVNYQGLGKSVFSVACRTVAWNGDIWVAGGEGQNTLAYSYDGKKWTGLGSTVFSLACYKVVSNGQVWVAVGAGGNTIARSTDGIFWTGLGSTILDVSGTGVDWNGSKWVAVGSRSVATSVDSTAQVWVSRNAVLSNANCVKWISDTWYVGTDVSGTSNTVASSSDGSSWSYLSVSPFSVTCKSITWNGRDIVAVGSGGNSTVSISTDGGLTWNATAVSAGTDGNGVEWNGKECIVAADGASPVNVLIGASLFPVSPSLLTNALCVGANSGIGAKVFNNRLYLNAGNILVVYGPESYDAALLSDTSVSLNMNLPL